MKRAIIAAMLILSGAPGASACMLGMAPQYICDEADARQALVDMYREAKRLDERARDARRDKPGEVADALNRQAVWVARCKPEIAVNDQGQRYRVYAAPDCTSGP